jgi:hypothetical protein
VWLPDDTNFIVQQESVGTLIADHPPFLYRQVMTAPTI